MRRDRRGHADGDAVGAVDQQVRKLRRQHGRLGVPLVVGGHEVDRVELQVLEHHRRERRHAGFGVPHGGRRQAGDRAEVALLVDQHVPHVPFLGHADQRGIDDAFAVRMVVAAGVAGDLGALHAAGAGREVQVVHRHQNPPLRRLQPVAHVGQRPADDHAHRVRQVAVLQLVFDRQIDQPQGDGLLLRVFGRGGIGRIGRTQASPFRRDRRRGRFGEPAMLRQRERQRSLARQKHRETTLKSTNFRRPLTTGRRDAGIASDAQ